MRPNCTLELSNGQSFTGKLIGAPLKSSGELVFTTGMVGYSEALTDPSYFGQILTFTYPLIGNYGIPEVEKQEIYKDLPSGFESPNIHASGVIITVDSPEAFHWNSTQSLDQWLKDHNVPGIVALDTRHLVHQIRGSQNILGKIIPQDPEGVRKFSNIILPNEGDDFFDSSDHEILSEVSCKERIIVGSGSKRIAVVDCGVKWNIVRQLIDNGCEVEILPWDTKLNTVDCSGWLLSNGPGDPEKTGDLKNQIASLLDAERPILGICLGHQLLSLAAGAKTYRMPYGHRSHNQPVYLEGTRKGFVTSQNHGFVVDDKSIPEGWEVWFRNANDQTIEGIKHKTKPFRSAQFHPESAGGPRDTGWIIKDFVSEVK
jgi:carbamoyl-phosphate synthase small subunit